MYVKLKEIIVHNMYIYIYIFVLLQAEAVIWLTT